MAKDKKFGTFGGVFTPSILTILGVIMYMRLPWIVGQAGILLTIGIVLVAHIVSITTGLSVSSIATDKKVKAGGTYFIISRSLGLPIGGTLGIALFFGLSLSVSLYIIGFAESFLGFWDLPITKDTIRLTGTIAILFVGTLTFISTSLAIKTQYFIMAAIGLSLLSIFFGPGNFAPEAPLLNPIEDMSPLILLFAIFFPAVTGFEAGVSMSGDLADPKKSIPVGTISAIVVGVIMYISLTIFFGYRVNSDQLVNNPNILLDMSLFAPLVVAGIWGATMSSAIGSILGAPRILQATSSDRITPKLFAKGFGKTNEPRNALILTFIVAEAGILIGELNLIARIVSMFFITTYGFLNLSSALENWASTDFRPSFKIPAWISIVGALTCFILMLELDFVALIGATIIMSAIFLYLKRKELTLESGDTWEGVWSSILRAGLNRLTRIVKQQRNWRPNIILFSGDLNTRPYLLEFGRWLVHKRGILSNFNLIENRKSEHLIPRASSPLKENEDDFQGIFMRQMEVNDVYEGMETITKVYGFAGLEPNSVMLGWGRNSKQPEKFGRLIYDYSKLDYNIFALDFDKDIGFGEMRTIDVWWRGGSNNVALALTLLKFLQASPEWHEAKARIFIISDDSSLHNKIYKNMTALMEEHRLDATVKIINNAIEHRPVSDIIKIESMASDLVILGLPEVHPERTASLITNVNEIINDLNTVLLIRASSFFKPIYIGIERKKVQVSEKDPSAGIPLPKLAPLQLPAHEVLSVRFKQISSYVEDVFDHYRDNGFSAFQRSHTLLVEQVEALIRKSINDAGEILNIKEQHRALKAIAHIQSTFLFNLKRLIYEYKTETLPELRDSLSENTEDLLSNIGQLFIDTPDTITVFYERNKEPDKMSLWGRLLRRHKPYKRKVRLKALTGYFQKVIERKAIYELLKDCGIAAYQLNSELQKVFNIMNDEMQSWEIAIRDDSFDKQTFSKGKKKSERLLKEVSSSFESGMQKILGEMYATVHQSLQSVARDLDNLQANRLVSKKIKIARKQLPLKDKILEAIDYWHNNQQLVSNFFIEDLYLKSISNRIETILERMLSDIMISIDSSIKTRLNDLIDDLDKIDSGTEQKLNWPSLTEEIFNDREISNELLKDILGAVEELPDNLEVMAEESFQKIEQEQFSEAASISVNLRRYTEYLFETELIDPLQKPVSKLNDDLQETRDIAREVVRFVNYNLSFQEDNDQAAKESLEGVINSGRERIEKRIAYLDEAKEQLRNEIQKHTLKSFEKMNPLLVNRAIGELKQTIRSKESRKYAGKVRSFYDDFNAAAHNLLVQIVYKRSKGLLFARKISTAAGGYQTYTGQILDTVKKLTPAQDVLQRLPFYYRQMFLGKKQTGGEFLLERPFEMEQASEAIYTYKQGYSGALLVLGERHSGKSTLSLSIAAKHFEKQKIFQLYAPESGSCDPAEFKKRINQMLKHGGEYSDLFNVIPQDSVIIIHDLELWWQRNSDGFAIIDELMRLIDQHSSRCLFIVNCGLHSFRFINRIKNIDHFFIRAIECQPFDAEDIQKAIMLRHESSGLKFTLGSHSEDNLSNLRLARLFNAYFDLSGGNIGHALHCWISNIRNYQQNTLEIKMPSAIKENAFTSLDTDWLIWLQQFLLHKHLTVDRLLQISGTGLEKITGVINTIKRSALLIESEPGVLCINPYIHPVLIKQFKEMDML